MITFHVRQFKLPVFKKGVFRLFREISSASPDKSKRKITRVVIESRIGDKLSAKRIDQLKNVKKISVTQKVNEEEKK